jgi:peptidoglycan/xylan/chitin deacetylase (PgdA/CDA1 family)
MTIQKQLLLKLYYYVSCPYRWWNHRRKLVKGRVPLVLLVYHRIADDEATPWTISNRKFCREIRWLESRFELISLKEAQERIRINLNVRPCVSITFDDGYADNCAKAIPLLLEKRIPCTYFVSLRNVLEGEPFLHDLSHGKNFLPNNLEQLRCMAREGIEIGAHSYSHVDLGKATDEQLYSEVVVAGIRLQRALGYPVTRFAFPFGEYDNLNPTAFLLAKQAGYEAACSAYGGYNFPGGDAFHLQRIPVDGSLIRLKNRATIDPRKIKTNRFMYELAGNSQP